MSETFGMYLRRLRRGRKASLRALADACGVDFTYISKIENDIVPPPSESTVEAMAWALNVDVNEMKAMAGVINREVLSHHMRERPSIARLVVLLQYGQLSDRQIEAMLQIANGQN